MLQKNNIIFNKGTIVLNTWTVILEIILSKRHQWFHILLAVTILRVNRTVAICTLQAPLRRLKARGKLVALCQVSFLKLMQIKWRWSDACLALFYLECRLWIWQRKTSRNRNLLRPCYREATKGLGETPSQWCCQQTSISTRQGDAHVSRTLLWPNLPLSK
jgi:hypothetical protein